MEWMGYGLERVDSGWKEWAVHAQRSTEHSTALLPYASTYSSGDPTRCVLDPCGGKLQPATDPPGLWVPKQEVKPYGEGL